MVGGSGDGSQFARNITRLVNSIRVRRRRRPPKPTPKALNPFHHLRLKARGRIFRPDGNAAPAWFGKAAPLLAIVAVAAGYGIAVLGDFNATCTLLAPFVLVGLVGLFATGVSLGAKILGVFFGVCSLALAWLL